MLASDIAVIPTPRGLFIALPHGFGPRIVQPFDNILSTNGDLYVKNITYNDLDKFTAEVRYYDLSRHQVDTDCEHR